LRQRGGPLSGGQSVPTVFALAIDPVGTGLVETLARPGGNLTGLSIQSSDLAGKRLDLLREVLPTLRTLGILANIGNLGSVREIDEVQAAAGANFTDLWRRAGDFVDKILRGTKPGDIPVEQPTKFELVINLTTAKALGLMIPESFLLRADEVFE